MSNQLVKQKPRFSIAIKSEAYQQLINNTLGDSNEARKFIANISSVVSVNPDLQDCDAGTIVSAGLLASSLNLSLSPQLSYCYLVPFQDNKRGRKVATFQLGYKGYLQLALRSGAYKKINVLDIKDGELLGIDLLNEEITSMMITDPEKREKAKTVGYYAMFELNDRYGGFKKIMYWSKEKMENHAIKYSTAYANDRKKGWSYSFWSKNFDGMAFKTMLRQLISKWGIMSIEMQEAFTKDMSILKDNGDFEYVDNDVEDFSTTSKSDFSDEDDVAKEKQNAENVPKGFEQETKTIELVDPPIVNKGKVKQDIQFKL